MTEPLRLVLIEMVSQNRVHNVGLGEFEFVGGSFGEFLVIIRDYDLFVLNRERPRAYIAIQRTSSAGITFDVVALFAQRLPITEIIRTVAGTGDFVVRAEFHVRLLRSAGGTLVPVLLFKFFPLRFAEFRPWFLLLAYIQTLQLIAVALLSNRRETFVALQCNSRIRRNTSL